MWMKSIFWLFCICSWVGVGNKRIHVFFLENFLLVSFPQTTEQRNVLRQFVLHCRLLFGDRPYWWVYSSGKYNETEQPLTQYRLTCETGPGMCTDVHPCHKHTRVNNFQDNKRHKYMVWIQENDIDGSPALQLMDLCKTNSWLATDNALQLIKAWSAPCIPNHISFCRKPFWSRDGSSDRLVRHHQRVQCSRAARCQIQVSRKQVRSVGV